MVLDTPLDLAGFTPSNYDKTFRGVVPADEAVARSLNVPAVRMLTLYNNSRFLALLRSMGLTTLDRSADHYGATLILGGAEDLRFAGPLAGNLRADGALRGGGYAGTDSEFCSRSFRNSGPPAAISGGGR